MNVRPLPRLPDVFVHEPPFRHEDNRGEIVCLWEYNEPGLGRFCKENISKSYQNVLRGIHGDFKTGKEIACLYGKIVVAIIDCRREIDRKLNENYGRWTTIELSDDNRLMVMVPPGFGIAHLVMSKIAVFWYRWSQPFDPYSQFTFRWDSFGIQWPISNPILSERDKGGIYIPDMHSATVTDTPR